MVKTTSCIGVRLCGWLALCAVCLSYLMREDACAGGDYPAAVCLIKQCFRIFMDNLEDKLLRANGGCLG